MFKLKKHTVTQSIFLHIFPGVVIVFICLAFLPVVLRNGFPNDMAILISDIAGLLPIELGLLLILCKKSSGCYSLKEQLPYLESSTIKEYLLFIPLMAFWALLLSSLLNPLEISIRDNIFSFIPSEYIMERYDITMFSKEKLLITGIFGVAANGFIAPIIEETYFRGYLLPRINLSPVKAAIVSAVLFSLYHFYSPWYFLSRVIMMIPLYYWVIKKKNIRFSILAHIISNAVTSLSFLLSVIYMN